jgi:hypothetical protein
MANWEEGEVSVKGAEGNCFFLFSFSELFFCVDLYVVILKLS